jgi:hypothetical protein
LGRRQQRIGERTTPQDLWAALTMHSRPPATARNGPPRKSRNTPNFTHRSRGTPTAQVTCARSTPLAMNAVTTSALQRPTVAVIAATTYRLRPDRTSRTMAIAPKRRTAQIKSLRPSTKSTPRKVVWLGSFGIPRVIQGLIAPMPRTSAPRRPPGSRWRGGPSDAKRRGEDLLPCQSSRHPVPTTP